MSFVKKVNVDSFYSTLAENTPAVSQPIRVICDDQNSYIVKTEHVYDETVKGFLHFNCSFINEFLSYCIAKHLGVPIPDAAVAQIDNDFLDDEPMLKFRNRFKEGEHFSSIFLEKTEENLMKDYMSLIQEGKSHLQKPWTKFFGNIVNPEDVSKIIMFDLLIGNRDRFNHPSNLMIQNDGGRKIIAIDHGHAFGGPFWNTEKFIFLHNQNNPQFDYVKWYCRLYVDYTHRRQGQGIIELNGLGNIFRALDEYVDISDISDHSFIQPLEDVQSINGALITSWLSEIPDAWFIDKPSQIDFYRTFLLNQIKFMPQLIQHLAYTQAFKSYTGGVLNWNVQNTGTQ